MADVKKVPFSTTTVGQCLCPGCPVQAESRCVAKLKEGLGAVLKRTPLKYEEVPGVYCGAGKATCTDLDPSKSCLCWSCPVFAQYKLAGGEPEGYYCRDGAPR